MVDDREELAFQDDKGASRSTWVAAALVIAIVGWMGSGYILPSEDADVPKASETRVSPLPWLSSSLRQSLSRSIFRPRGKHNRTATPLSAPRHPAMSPTSMVAKGEDVEAGTVIARLSATRAESDLARAREELARAQREFDNASQLLERGVATADRVAQARATLATAQSSVITAEETIESLEITAPFAGRIETLSLDAGEFIQLGADVGRIVDNRPLTVAIQVPQQALRRIKSGQTASVNFITGEERKGTVSFVGTGASAETRTFLTEITVPNEDGAIPAGISAEIRIPTGTVDAHFVQPSTVSLSPEGRWGSRPWMTQIPWCSTRSRSCALKSMGSGSPACLRTPGSSPSVKGS